MDAIILDIEGLFQTSLLFLKQCVSNRLKEIAIPEQLAATVNDKILKVCSDISIFQGLRSQHQQQKFFCSKFNLVVS